MWQDYKNANLHDMTDRMPDFGTFSLSGAGAGLLVDSVCHTATFLILVWLTWLAVAHTASSVLNCFTFLLVGHLTDLIIDSVALFFFNSVTFILVNCGTSWCSYNLIASCVYHGNWKFLWYALKSIKEFPLNTLNSRGTHLPSITTKGIKCLQN